MTAALHAVAPARTADVPVVAPGLRIADTPAAAVLRVARREGPIFRDAAAARTGLSLPTVNRHVVALVEAGLLRERADLAPSGAVGRPRLPFELRREPHLTVGIHIGYRTTTITTHDLHGRVLGGIRTSTSGDDAPDVLAAVGDRARRFLARWPGRRPLWAGVALGGRVDEHGRVEHSRLGWREAPVGELIGARLGLPISVAPHVESMAAAELSFGPPHEPHGSTLYCYARETIGVALTIDGAVHNPRTGPGGIGHLPAGPTELLDPRRTGRLDDAVSDTGVVEAARTVGLPVGSTAELAARGEAGDGSALALLRERARVLGRCIGQVADVINPDRIILGGQAFTEFSGTPREVARSAAENSAVPQREFQVTAAGNGIQQQAAAAVSLDFLYADPLAALRHANRATSARGLRR
ncbi:ROK family transcriptional regulator [Saccharopolyspora gloriosae]|uniref:Putative NBD/HSP70 family sugar kinase n=1 Tax=Saccharopolyspora gloriosae TaxID=455344 RepID=A0A840NA55_9PSEU|nr:ROK family transcriptional regulator [Saccharopolyspora gloriosae]MBB5068840.1 putative NBD/HSP70 family sugar kinase [Saccharopolyspora gloriosae]